MTKLAKPTKLEQAILAELDYSDLPADRLEKLVGEPVKRLLRDMEIKKLVKQCYDKQGDVRWKRI